MRHFIGKRPSEPYRRVRNRAECPAKTIPKCSVHIPGWFGMPTKNSPLSAISHSTQPRKFRFSSENNANSTDTTYLGGERVEPQFRKMTKNSAGKTLVKSDVGGE